MSKDGYTEFKLDILFSDRDVAAIRARAKSRNLSVQKGTQVITDFVRRCVDSGLSELFEDDQRDDGQE